MHLRGCFYHKTQEHAAGTLPKYNPRPWLSVSSVFRYGGIRHIWVMSSSCCGHGYGFNLKTIGLVLQNQLSFKPQTARQLNCATTSLQGDIHSSFAPSLP
ncbi:hypothetical protein KP509_08G005700 [Ceratopteris richardii]|uniref:Uncharacterized protein n=1 Tax=Ceratopteris richardii TaxID=49495 RepID=A0A8T2U384_CERRI|nr:hypothetical protein KP509_08G005700 [Ceratopteris richardii]